MLLLMCKYNIISISVSVSVSVIDSVTEMQCYKYLL